MGYARTLLEEEWRKWVVSKLRKKLTTRTTMVRARLGLCKNCPVFRCPIIADGRRNM